jgi:transcriptional regulator with XRE-family HTH domain
MAFKERLQAALSGQALKQSQLAKEVGVSPSLASMWLKGTRKPDEEMMERLAQALDTDVEWLRSGTGREPLGTRERALEGVFEKVEWRPRAGFADGARDGGNANQFAIPPSFRNLVREAIQNAVDERLGQVQPVDVRFRLLSLRSEAKSRYLEAMRWPDLRPHFKACAEQRGDEQAAGGFGEALRAADSGELMVLQIIDSGTRGLTGPETGDGNFAALTRDSLYSHKNKEGAAGSYGLGKATQYAASAFGTVLFLSDLSEHEPKSGNRTGRFFGRAELVWHELEDKDGETRSFSGPAWLGEAGGEEGEVPVSHWVEAGGDVLVRDLQMSRVSGATGTTIAVVGLRDLDADKRRTPREIIEQIGREIEENFWPAIEAGELSARVEYIEIDDPTVEPAPEVDSLVAPAQSRISGPLVHSVRAHANDEAVEVLIDDGDVVAGFVELNVPARKGGDEADRHPAFTHKAVALVRRAAPDELESESGGNSSSLRRAALMRGANIVVKTLDLNKGTVGAQPFHVVVLAGRAAGDSQEDRWAEEFLRTAEPPSHDNWTTTPRLKRLYSPGYTKGLREFEASIRHTVRELLSVESNLPPDGPGDLSRRFRFGEPPTPERAPRIVMQAQSVADDGSWHIEGAVRFRGDLSRGAAGRPEVVFLGESGGRARVKWRSLEALGDGMSVRDGDTVVVSPNVRTGKFRGVTDPESHPAPARETVASLQFTPSRRDA